VIGAVESAQVVQVVLAVCGASGIVGAIVAMLKLKPDANSAAVTQAQGAMETMEKLNAQLEAERDEWRQRALDCEAERGGRTDARE
jgi:3-polyprenyl-4-hydroxybenzoate decarboxylase